MEISTKKKKNALILCILTGWLGIHRFYVGKTKSGILILLMSLSIILVYPFVMALFILIGIITRILTISLMVALPLGFYWDIFIIPVIFLWVVIDFILILTDKFKDREGYRLK